MLEQYYILFMYVYCCDWLQNNVNACIVEKNIIVVGLFIGSFPGPRENKFVACKGINLNTVPVSSIRNYLISST